MANALRVLVGPGGPIPTARGAVNYTFRNATANFRVSYDAALGLNGPPLADGVLATCEPDLAAMVGVLQVTLPVATLPVSVFIDVGSFGAYHGNCADTELHLAAFTGNNADLVRFLLVSELDECFMAAQGGWNCGDSSGEGLSRVLATERYPRALNGFASAPSWLDGSRPNWVDNTDPTDRSYPSIGCAVLFLNFFRYQLHFTWAQIVGAGAPTLAATYAKLTGHTNGWTRFSSLVNSRYPAGIPSGVTSDNIFPI